MLYFRGESQITSVLERKLLMSFPVVCSSFLWSRQQLTQSTLGSRCSSEIVVAAKNLNFFAVIYYLLGVEFILDFCTIC